MKRILAIVSLLSIVPAVHAQSTYYVGGNAYGNAGDALIAQRIRDVLAYKPQARTTTQGSSLAAQSQSRPQAQQRVASAAPARPSASAIATLRFTPSGSGDAIQKFANDLGHNAEERKQLQQAIAATKASFEQNYDARGWKNNVAGAYTFFIGSMGYVWSGNEPDIAAQNRLFDAMTIALAELPDLGKASNQDKAALYDTLIATTALPLLLYIDGSQKNNKAQMEQARTLAAEYSRKIMHVEPDALAGMLK